MSLPDPCVEDVVAVSAMVGRPLAGRFAVVVRRRDGRPAVIENEPHLRDGTPMPTLYWLVDPQLRAAVSRLESEGGVHRFESEVDEQALDRTHEAYARRRDAAIVRGDLVAPRGGVGGTRRGVKCLHAHLANYLVGAEDPVGRRVADDLAEAGEVIDDLVIDDLVIVDRVTGNSVTGNSVTGNPVTGDLVTGDLVTDPQGREGTRG